MGIIYTKLNMWRIFYPDGIQFKYLMLNIATGKYQFVNFSKNLIEPAEYENEEDAIQSLEYQLEQKVILEYQAI